VLVGTAEWDPFAARAKVVDAMLTGFTRSHSVRPSILDHYWFWFGIALDRYAVVNDLEAFVWKVVAPHLAKKLLDVAIVHKIARPAWA
jgi:hypothetical protein